LQLEEEPESTVVVVSLEVVVEEIVVVVSLVVVVEEIVVVEAEQLSQQHLAELQQFFPMSSSSELHPVKAHLHEEHSSEEHFDEQSLLQAQSAST
jgi:hypothetical protein